MFKQLFKVSLFTAFNNFSNSQKAKAKNKNKEINPIKSLIILLVILTVCVCPSITMFFLGIAMAAKSVGSPWLTYSLVLCVDFLIVFIGSVFMTKSQLFEAKDNEFLIAMPIKPQLILLSRMFFIYIYELAISVPFFLIPTIIVIIATKTASVIGVIIFLVYFLLVPLFSLALSSFFGWIISIISQKLKNKSIVTSIITFILIIAYIGFISFMSRSFDIIETFLPQIGSFIQTKLTPIYWLGASVSNGNALYTLFSILILIIPFALSYFIVSKFFNSILTTKYSAKRNVYKEKEAKVSSPNTSLLKKEFNMLFCSPTYLINASIGIIFNLIAAVALIIMTFNQNIVNTINELGSMKSMVCGMIILGNCMFNGMSLITAVSISLEGKTLPLLKSLPVTTKQIFNAKLKMQLFLSVPSAIILSIASIIFFDMNLYLSIVCILLPVVFSFASAVIGLVENIRHPNFNWQTEAQAVKTGWSVFFAMIIMMGLSLLPLIPVIIFGLISTLSSAVMPTFLLVYCVVIAIFTYVLYRYLNTTGVSKFDKF